MEKKSLKLPWFRMEVLCNLGNSWKKHLKSGNYTIEAAFIIGLILILVAGFLYSTFYLHDREILFTEALYTMDQLEGMMKQPVTEEGHLGTEKIKDADWFDMTSFNRNVNASRLKETYEKRVEKKLIITKLLQVEIDIKSSGITFNYLGESKVGIGGILGKLLKNIGVIERRISSGDFMSPEEVVRLKKTIFND